MNTLRILIIVLFVSLLNSFSAHSEVENELVKGKWINKENGTKVFSFKSDFTFEFD